MLPLPVMLPCRSIPFAHSPGKTRLRDFRQQTPQDNGSPEAQVMFSWVHIYLLRAHPCPQCLDIQPGSSVCYGSYPGCDSSAGSHYIKSQLMTTSHQKPFSLSSPPPADVLAALQGAKLAENSPCAGWGLGKGHS